MNKVGIKVFVNVLTVFRCLFTFAMPFLINKATNVTFIIIVAVLYLTDWVDGFVSRKCGVQTLFGSIMDTVADKVLGIILIVCLPDKHIILYLMMIGEIIIGITNLIGTINGASISSTFIGKLKMWGLAAATIFGYMKYFGICDNMLPIIFGTIVIIMQVIVIFIYSKRILQIKKVDFNKTKIKRGKELKHALFDTEYYLSTIEEPILKKLTLE